MDDLNNPPEPKIVSLNNTTWFYSSFLRELEKEIQGKAYEVQAGIDKFSKAEMFAYMVLQNNGYFEVDI